MPQIDISGSDSKLSCDKIQGQSGTTVTVPTGHTVAITDSGGLTLAGTAVNAGALGVDGITSSANATAITINSSEQVGIGTTSPSQPLHILNASGSSTSMRIENSNADFLLQAGSIGDGGLAIYDWDNSAYRLLINNSGKVAIGGNTTPNSYDADASNLVIGNASGATGMTISSGSSSVGSIYFADGTSGNTKYRGYLTYTHSGTEKMAFGVSASTAMTIDSGGQVGIGIGSPTNFVHVEKWKDSKYMAEFKNLGSTNPHCLSLKFNYGSLVDGHNTKYINCVDTSATRMIVYGDGDIQNHDNSYGGTSDEKLKQDITDSSSQWDDVKALGKIVRKFRFKTDVEADPNASFRLGFVAQEVEEISPALVKDNPDTEEVEVPSVDEEGNPVVDNEGNPIMETIHRETGTTTKAVKYSIAYMKAFKALGEAMERIEALEQDVAILKGGN